MRLGRNVLLSAPVLAVALLVVTTIAAADTPAPAPVGLAIDVFAARNGNNKPVVTSPAIKDLGDIQFETSRSIRR
jgi:hypothetical protein